MRHCSDKKEIGTYQVHADQINGDIEATDGNDVYEVIRSTINLLRSLPYRANIPWVWSPILLPWKFKAKMIF